MKPYYYLLALSLVLFSCRKDEVIVSETPFSCDDISVSPSSIEMGNTNDVFIRTFNDTNFYGAYHTPDSFRIDADQDGRDDYLFISSITGSPAVGMIPNLVLYSIHSDALIGFYSTIDSVFNSENIEYSSGPFDTAPFEYLHIIRSTCDPQGYEGETITTTEATDVASYHMGDECTLTNTDWASERGFDFPIRTLSYPIDLISTNGDTSYYERRISQFGCNHFPTHEERYIPIKTNTCGLQKLGWIKVLYGGGSGIILKEIALQP